MMPLVTRFSGTGHADLVRQVLDRFFHDGDPTQFGLMNAVTSLARDTRDPDLEWDLEVLGGGIAVGAVPPRPVGGRPKDRTRRLQAVG
jgi:hypothetical protein